MGLRGWIRKLLMSPRRFGKILTEVEESEAHAELCRRVYGRNLGQFNAASMREISLLVERLGADPTHTIYDVGCGNGLITEHIAELTGSRLHGFDFAPDAIDHASRRKREPSLRVDFTTLDLIRDRLPHRQADAIFSIDVLYSVILGNLGVAVDNISAALRPGGRIVTLYTQQASRAGGEVLKPECTELADALVTRGFQIHWLDLSDDELDIWERILSEAKLLRPAFVSEGRVGLWRLRMFEARRMSKLCRAGRRKRYLYWATRSAETMLEG